MVIQVSCDPQVETAPTLGSIETSTAQVTMVTAVVGNSYNNVFGRNECMQSRVGALI